MATSPKIVHLDQQAAVAICRNSEALVLQLQRKIIDIQTDFKQEVQRSLNHHIPDFRQQLNAELQKLFEQNLNVKEIINVQADLKQKLQEVQEVQGCLQSYVPELKKEVNDELRKLVEQDLPEFREEVRVKLRKLFKEELNVEIENWVREHKMEVQQQILELRKDWEVTMERQQALEHAFQKDESVIELRKEQLELQNVVSLLRQQVLEHHNEHRKEHGDLQQEASLLRQEILQLRNDERVPELQKKHVELLQGISSLQQRVMELCNDKRVPELQKEHAECEKRLLGLHGDLDKMDAKIKSVGDDVAKTGTYAVALNDALVSNKAMVHKIGSKVDTMADNIMKDVNTVCQDLQSLQEKEMSCVRGDIADLQKRLVMTDQMQEQSLHTTESAVKILRHGVESTQETIQQLQKDKLDVRVFQADKRRDQATVQQLQKDKLDVRVFQADKPDVHRLGKEVVDLKSLLTSTKQQLGKLQEDSWQLHKDKLDVRVFQADKADVQRQLRMEKDKTVEDGKGFDSLKKCFGGYVPQAPTVEPDGEQSPDLIYVSSVNPGALSAGFGAQAGPNKTKPSVSPQKKKAEPVAIDGVEAMIPRYVDNWRTVTSGVTERTDGG